MRASSWLLTSVLAVGSLAASARPASGCSCVSTPSPCQAFATSPIVFIGDVLSVEETGRDFHMRLRVVRALKGITEETADLWSDAHTSCGVRLQEGKRYVIYTSSEGGRMSIHACGYGRAIASGEPAPELPPVPGRVYGRVSRYDIDRIREFRALEPVSAVPLTLSLPAGPVTATSDQWGRFEFSDVPPGRHQLSANPGPGLKLWMSGTVTMPMGPDCVDTSVVLQPSGQVSGRVMTAEQKPGNGIYLRLLPEGRTGSRLQLHVDLAATTDANGRFAIDGLEAGRYALAVNPDGDEATGRQPYAPTFFGGSDRASATRIVVGEGAHVVLDRPFVLPPPLATRTFTVAVSCRDGSLPAARMTRAMPGTGTIFAEFAEGEDGPVDTLRIVRDQAYTLLVTIYVPATKGTSDGPRRAEELAPIELPAGMPGRHYALVAPFSNCAEGKR
jgi:hypothetical protein